MPSKKCMICGQLKAIDEKSLCCDVCEEKELDLLVTVYAFLHCSDQDFYPIVELVKEIEPINGVQLSSTFIRSWLKRQWLDKNAKEEVCIPGTVQEELMSSGFSLNETVLDELDRLATGRPKHDAKEFERKSLKEDKGPRIGMAYMDRQRKSGGK